MKQYSIELWYTDSVPRSIIVEHTEHPYPAWYGDHAIIKYTGGLMTVATTFVTAIVISAIEEGRNKNELANELTFEQAGLIQDFSFPLKAKLWQWWAVPPSLKLALRTSGNEKQVLVMEQELPFFVPYNKAILAGFAYTEGQNFLHVLDNYVRDNHETTDLFSRAVWSLSPMKGSCDVFIYGNRVYAVWGN